MIAPSFHETAEKIIVAEAREDVEALLAAVRQDTREAVLPEAWETAAQIYWLRGSDLIRFCTKVKQNGRGRRRHPARILNPGRHFRMPS